MIIVTAESVIDAQDLSETSILIRRDSISKKTKFEWDLFTSYSLTWYPRERWKSLKSQSIWKSVVENDFVELKRIFKSNLSKMQSVYYNNGSIRLNRERATMVSFWEAGEVARWVEGRDFLQIRFPLKENFWNLFFFDIRFSRNRAKR